MLVIIIHATDTLSLWGNILTRSIPSEIGFLTQLSESSVVWLLVVMIGVMFSMVLSMRVVIFHSTAYLDLAMNSLRGMIPSEIGFLTQLSESSVVCLFVVTIGVVCFIVISCSSSFFIRQLNKLSRAIV
jgi:uncharacterized membrane protein